MEMPSISLPHKSTPRTIDELVRTQADVFPDTPILSYPSKGTTYLGYSLKQLDGLAYQAAKQYSASLPQRNSSSDRPLIVSLLGVSDLAYVVTLLAVSKLGHSVLLLSPRLAIPAYHHLLSSTESRHLIYQSEFSAKTNDICAGHSGLSSVPIADVSKMSSLLTSDVNTNMLKHLDLSQEQENTAWVFHSSGSTGLPKPVRLSHQSALDNYKRNIDSLGMRSFLSLPLFHTHGISTLFRAFYTGKQVRMYNASLPVTKQHLIDSLNGFPSEIFCAVPYALKLLSESTEGIELLKKFQVVTFGGSACPEPLGDMLTRLGVHLVNVYGMSELGPVMTSARSIEDKDWNYLRPTPRIEPYLNFEDRGEGLFELICLAGWPSKSATNRPDGSYATKDLFLKHSTLNAWKYIGRIDDVVVLETGEKANPIPIEGGIKQHPLVLEAVVFGAQKPCFGVMVVPSEEAAAMEPKQLIEELFPVLNRSQDTMPAYAKISQDMIVVLPVGIEYPRTDKGTVIRQSFYKKFEETINMSYVDRKPSNALKLSETDLRTFLRETVREVIDIDCNTELDDDTDLYELGFDSLTGLRMRNIIVKSIDTGNSSLGNNIVFDNPSIRLLAAKLYALRTKSELEDDSLDSRMKRMIQKYSRDSFHRILAEEEHIVVTGVTGSLGAHTVAQLAAKESVKKVYCLIRATSNDNAHERMYQSLCERGLWHTLSQPSQRKIICLQGDLTDPTLSLRDETLARIRHNLTSVYHCAWKVNFNLRLESFEKDCIAGLRNLIDLCLHAETREVPRLCFCSSIGTVLRSSEKIIPEEIPNNFAHAQPTGYGQSKLVGEHICDLAMRHERVPIYTIRIGQIVGDTKLGIWNKLEAFPLMIQTASTLGILPSIDENLRWLPVDIAAASIIEIMSSGSHPGVFNLVNPDTLHWTKDLLPHLKDMGLQFDIVDPPTWVDRLKGSDPDPAKNPAIRLLEYFTTQYNTTEPRRGFEFDVAKSQDASESFKNARAPDARVLTKIVEYLTGDHQHASTS